MGETFIRLDPRGGRAGGKSRDQAFFLLATPVKSGTLTPTCHASQIPQRLPRRHHRPTGRRHPPVTKAARVLGVHPNTVRAWSEAGRLRYYRINERGDRRYRLGDLQRFLERGRVARAVDAAGAPARGSRAATPAPTLTETAAGLDLLADLAEVASFPSGLDPALEEACRRIRVATGAAWSASGSGGPAASCRGRSRPRAPA